LFASFFNHFQILFCLAGISGTWSSGTGSARRCFGRKNIPANFITQPTKIVKFYMAL